VFVGIVAFVGGLSGRVVGCERNFCPSTSLVVSCLVLLTVHLQV
jgi:hypothetical protein